MAVKANVSSYASRDQGTLLYACPHLKNSWASPSDFLPWRAGLHKTSIAFLASTWDLIKELFVFKFSCAVQITLPVPSCITNVRTIIKRMMLRTRMPGIEVLICPPGVWAGRPAKAGRAEWLSEEYKSQETTGVCEAPLRNERDWQF